MKVKYYNLNNRLNRLKSKYRKAFNTFINSGEYVLGGQVSSFEVEFADYLKASYCVGVASGLDAIKIALRITIKPGDYVITTPISAAATTMAIQEVGGIPLFVDTDKNGLITAENIEKAINPKVKAVLLVHLYGMPCDMINIVDICKKNQLVLIEDSCQAHGSSLYDKKLGTFGDIGCFSFYPTKNLGALGDGGALVTNNKEISDKAKILRDYGQSSKYVHVELGYNSRLDELQAALLRIGLKDLDKEISIRHDLYKIYLKNLNPDKIIDSGDFFYGKLNYHIMPYFTENRDDFRQFMLDNGVETAIHYPMTLDNQPYMKDTIYDISKKDSLVNANNFCSKVVSLPLNSSLTTKDIYYVCSLILKWETLLLRKNSEEKHDEK